VFLFSLFVLIETFWLYKSALLLQAIS